MMVLKAYYNLPQLPHLENKGFQLRIGAGMFIKLEHEVHALPPLHKENQRGNRVIILIT